MVADHLGDDEVDELLGEFRVEPGIVGKRPQPGDLPLLAGGSAGGIPASAFEAAHRLGCALGEQVHERGIDVVDAAAQAGQLAGASLTRAILGARPGGW